MRRFIKAGALPCLISLLSACSNVSPAQQAQITQALAVACYVDGVTVPIAQPIIASLGPNGAAVANWDSLLLHPAVIQACAALNGTPASVAPATGAPSTPTK